MAHSNLSSYDSETAAFKPYLPNKITLARDIAAFANSRGGQIYIGYMPTEEEATRAIGLPSIEVFKVIEVVHKAVEYLTPYPFISTTNDTSEKREFVIVTVHKHSVPVLFNGRYYVRKGSETTLVKEKPDTSLLDSASSIEQSLEKRAEIIDNSSAQNKQMLSIIVEENSSNDNLEKGQIIIPKGVKPLLGKLKVLFCYAHKDERLLDSLKAHLQPMRYEGLMTTWHDRDISPGANWEEKIDEHLDTAHIILLLVSPDFMASKYCYGTEMTRAIERHEQGEVLAIPIILRPTDWEKTPLGKLQALPKNGKAITTWHHRDEGYLDAAKGLRKAIEEMGKQQKIVATSVIEQADLDDRGYKARKTEAIHPVHIREIDGEVLAKIQRDLEEKLQRQREADNFLLEARKFASSLMEKDELVRQAVNLYPAYKHKELRQLGIELSTAVLDGCDPTIQMGTLIASLGRSGTTPYRRLTKEDIAWLAATAITYLQENVLEATTPDAEGLLYLACMYGYHQQFEQMMKSIQRAIQFDEGVKKRSRQRKVLLMLLCACRLDQTQIQKLNEMLDIAPVLKEDFCQFIQNFDPNFDGYIEWVAVKRPEDTREKGIFVIHITPPYEHNKGKVVASALSVASWQGEKIANGELISISEVYDAIHASFVLLCPPE